MFFRVLTQSLSFRCLALACLALPLLLWPPSHLRADDLNQRFQDTARPLLSRYCLDCHNQDGAEADVSLEEFNTAAEVRDRRALWLRVLNQLRAGSMPPDDMEQPTAAERTLLMDWVEQTINQVDCSEPVDPGHVTLRRLNRYEYRNTVRDLLGVDYEPAADFPADDVGYGFDNIGDVLSLPPLLMEKYLTAAEEIAQRAIVVSEEPPAVQRTINAKDLDGHGAPVDGFARSLASSGEAYWTVEIPRAGVYRLRAQAAGDQAGSEPVKMSVRVDGRDIRVHDVQAPRTAPGRYTTYVALDAGAHRLGLAFVNDYYRPAEDGRAAEDRNLWLGDIELRGPVGREDRSLPDSHRRIFVARPGPDMDAEAAARRVLTPLAQRALRRGAEPDEIDRLVRLVELADQQGDSFEVGIQLAVQALLVSPHFLFRVESDPGTDEDSRLLNDYELATRLSYFLWSSMPDEELFELARQAALRDGDTLQQQARRMLRDPKSQALIENFAGQWLQLRSLEDLVFDANRFPNCDRELLAAMRTETLRFFEEIVRNDLSLLRILDADFTFVNETLARHYGMAGVTGESFRRVSLEGMPRAGVLTQASLLAVTSNPTRTSPVKRGKFVLENLLGAPPPPAPPNVPLLEDEGRQLSGTLRQRMEQHRTNPSCASCHQLMDPIGFALENYDAVGRYRDKDDGEPIDASGKLPSGEQFSGFAGLLEILVQQKREQFLRCMAEKMLIYAVGRGLEYYDQCAVDEIVNGLEQDDYRFSRLVLEVVKTDPFQKQGKNRSRE